MTSCGMGKNASNKESEGSEVKKVIMNIFGGLKEVLSPPLISKDSLMIMLGEAKISTLAKSEKRILASIDGLRTVNRMYKCVLVVKTVIILALLGLLIMYWNVYNDFQSKLAIVQAVNNIKSKKNFMSQGNLLDIANQYYSITSEVMAANYNNEYPFRQYTPLTKKNGKFTIRKNSLMFNVGIANEWGAISVYGRRYKSDNTDVNE
jgi:hypothetical protein